MSLADDYIKHFIKEGYLKPCKRSGALILTGKGSNVDLEQVLADYVRKKLAPLTKKQLAEYLLAEEPFVRKLAEERLREYG